MGTAATVTLLFSDIEGSTRALARLGPRWGDALSDQRRLLRSAFRTHAGREMGTEGDSFFVVFDSARDALGAAIEGQRHLHEHTWPGNVRLRVRIGMHTGEPQPHEDGYIGLDVHRAARIAATASGGQIVLSEASRTMVADLDGGAAVRDLGWHRLKDLDRAEHLYDVVVPDLPADFPPLRSLGTRANLPSPPTALIGRSTELSEVVSTLTTGGARLLTLTGPGGTGKTRMALAAAAELEHAFPHGLFFVPLDTVDRAAVMWAAMADTVGANGDVERLPKDAVTEFLSDRELLLVLDNLEQVADADRVIAELLEAVPSVHVLATSRRPMHLVAEHEYPLSPLPLPTPGTLDLAEVERVPSVELFALRAGMVNPRFALTESNVDHVSELCRRLDGLPLAIELAAARSRLLGPRALLNHLDARLGLGVTAADRSERQRTLGATIAWSYDLLDAGDQATFRRLGVFGKACDLEAVERVVGPDLTDPLSAVEQLVDASLVQANEGTDGEPRIGMLQTIRSFARDLLDASSECDEVRLRHARWCLDAATGIRELLGGPRQMAALDRMDDVEEDVRAALDWCLRPLQGTDQARTECGFQLLSALARYWYRFGYVAEGRGWHERALEVMGGAESRAVLDALHHHAIVMLQQSDVAQATTSLERALEMARRLGERDLVARELNSLGVARREAGQPVEARALLEQSISLAREIGSAQLETTARTNQAMLLLDTGDYAEAVVACRQVVERDRRRGDPWGVAINQTNLALALLRAEGPRSAYDHLARIAQDTVAMADTELSIALVELFAAALAELDDAVRAARLIGAADAQRSEAGIPRSEPDERHLGRSLEPARRGIPDLTWSNAWENGRQLSIDQAVADALAATIR